jgi:ABC-type antimicrobial peptide transport system permease subunit
MIKFLPYVLRSAWRNRIRTALTVLGVGVAVFLVVWLAALLDSRTRTVEMASKTTLLVNEKDVY